MRWAPVALDFTRLAMEVAWISIAGGLVFLLLGAIDGLVPIWLGLAVAALGFILTRWIVPGDAPITAARWIVAIGGAVVIFVGIGSLPAVNWDYSWPLWFWEDWLTGRHVVSGGLMLAVFWWRGTHLGQENVWLQSLAQSFRIGIGIVVVGVVVDVVLPIATGSAIATFVFFGAGITAFALSHITSMSPEQSAGLRDWPRMMALTVGGIVIGSVVLAVAAEGDLGRGAAAVLGIVATILTPFVAVIGWVLELVVRALVYLAFALVGLIAGDGDPIQFNLPPPPNFDGVRSQDVSSNPILSWLLRIGSWTVVGATILVVALFLWRLFSGIRARRARSTPDEERERLESETTMRDDVSAAMAALAGRFRRNRNRAKVTSGLDGHNPVAVALGAYRGLLALAEDHGLIRHGWETPDEFHRQLHELFVGQEVGIFTDSFVRARYGGIAPSAVDVDRIRATWASVRATYPAPQKEKTAKEPSRSTPARGPLPRWMRMRPDLRPHEESVPPAGMGPDDARMM